MIFHAERDGVFAYASKPHTSCIHRHTAHSPDEHLMVFDALDETAERVVPLQRPVRRTVAVIQVLHGQLADRVHERVHLHLHLVDDEHHGQHHARDAGQHGQRDGELDGVHGRVLGGREPRPRRPHAEYERGRRVDVAVAGRPHDRCHAHGRVGHREYGAVGAHEPGEQPVRARAPPVVPELAAHQRQHAAELGPLAHADREQRQRAGRAGEQRQRLDRLLVATDPRDQRRHHRGHYERPEAAYQPRVRGGRPSHHACERKQSCSVPAHPKRVPNARGGGGYSWGS